MATLALEQVTKVFDERRRGRSARSTCSSRTGEFVVLVGPSGCGKTTVLRMVAGLEEVTSGTIRLDGKVVNDLSARDRDVAMVFQNYALYPHLNVLENIAFSLRVRGVPKHERERKARAGGRRAWALGATCSAQARASSRAASASGSRWAGRSFASPRSS